MALRRARARELSLAACWATAMLPGAALAEPVAVSVAPFVWALSLKGQLTEGTVAIPLDAGVGDLAGGAKEKVLSRRVGRFGMDLDGCGLVLGLAIGL